MGDKWWTHVRWKGIYLASIAFEHAQNLEGILAFDIPYSGWHCLGVREHVQRLNMTSFESITH